MKKIEKIVISYRCEICQNLYTSEKLAAGCEKSHYPFSIGDRVIYDIVKDGGYSHVVKSGIVLKTKIDFCLVDFEDETRDWCKNITLRKE